MKLEFKHDSFFIRQRVQTRYKIYIGRICIYSLIVIDNDWLNANKTD